MEQEKKNFTDRYNNLLNDLQEEVINLVKSNPYYKNNRLDFDNYKSNDAVLDIVMDNIVQVYDDVGACFYDAYVQKICLCDDGQILVTAYGLNIGDDVDDVLMSVDNLYTLWYILNEIKKL